MDVRLRRENLVSGGQLRAQPQQVSVEADATLPGGLRDEVLLFHTQARALPLQAEAAGNRVTVSGQVIFQALYSQGDLTRVRSVEEMRDFSRALTVAAPESAAAIANRKTNSILFKANRLLAAIVRREAMIYHWQYFFSCKRCSRR